MHNVIWDGGMANDREIDRPSLSMERHNKQNRAYAAGPAYYVLHPQKGITIFVFLTYQAFKNREGIVSQTNLAEGFKI